MFRLGTDNTDTFCLLLWQLLLQWLCAGHDSEIVRFRYLPVLQISTINHIQAYHCHHDNRLKNLLCYCYSSGLVETRQCSTKPAWLK